MYTVVNNTYKDSKSLVLNKEFLIYLSVRCQKFAKAVDGGEKKKRKFLRGGVSTEDPLERKFEGGGGWLN